jgi:hypothetical protein
MVRGMKMKYLYDVSPHIFVWKRTIQEHVTYIITFCFRPLTMFIPRGRKWGCPTSSCMPMDSWYSVILNGLQDMIYRFVLKYGRYGEVMSYVTAVGLDLWDWLQYCFDSLLNYILIYLLMINTLIWDVNRIRQCVRYVGSKNKYKSTATHRSLTNQILIYPRW